MSTDKYQPCPCGSGKKLKFCCYETHARLAEADVYYDRAKTQMSLLQIDKAIACLRKVIELDGGRGSVGRQAKADLDALASSIRKSSGLTLDGYMKNAARFKYAFGCLMDGGFEEAIRGFNAVLESEPRHVQSHGNLGLAYAALGDKVAAIRHLDKAIELDPAYEPAIDNRQVILALKPGEKLFCSQMREIEFYSDKWLATRSSSARQSRRRVTQLVPGP
jgi:tetratricopeptide (TPR) repeat protein